MSPDIPSPSLILSDYARGASILSTFPASPAMSAYVGRRNAIKSLILDRPGEYSGRGAYVIPADPTMPARPVLNLGWLLRHRDDVLHPLQGLAFTVSTWRYQPRNGGIRQVPTPVETFDPVLMAHLADGRTYATQWADPRVLKAWLDRPSFRGYLCDWEGRASSTTCAIGGADWRALEIEKVTA